MAEGDPPFVASACLLVVLAFARLCSFCASHRAFIWKTVSGWIRAALVRQEVTPSAESKYIDEKILQEKTELARKIIFVLLYFAVGNLLNILYNIFMENPLWMSTSGCWILVITVALLLLAQVPWMLSSQTVDLWSAILQMVVLAFMSTLATSAHETLMLGSGLFVTVCVPAVAFANRSSVLLFCQLALVLHAIVRAVMDFEEFELASACNALNDAQSFVFAHLVFLPLALSVSSWAHQLIKHRVESRFRESKSQTQLCAASALLDLTCDAVVELDEDLRLLSHSGKLAALLMRNRAGATLKGLKFTELVVPADVERVTQVLETCGEEGSTDALAHVFRTHLTDSYDSKFCAEVFQVKFTMASGEKCHITGLRDVTDVQPLADHSFAHVDRDPEVGKNAGCLEGIMEIDISRHPMSRQISDISTQSMECSEVERSSNVITKEVFLEIDVEQELVTSATAPLLELVGQGLSGIGFSPFALQTCKRLCQDAKEVDLVHEVLPDQTAHFNDMPLLVLAPHMLEASGFMKVVRTHLGSFHALVCVRKRRMSIQPRHAL